jgi:galactose-6-phosphate isomerase
MMALLNVTLQGLYDPMFLDNFSVQRRKETVGLNGRSVTSTMTFQNEQGVVTMASGKELERLPNDQVFDRVISVVTAFALQGEVQKRQPDVIIWRGDKYIVKAIDLYPQFGPGFVQAICASMDLVDQATSNDPGLIFNVVQNSAYLGSLKC